MSEGLLLNSQIGEYRLVSFLGKGGMGEVYRGVHTKIGRTVAVKILSRAASNASLSDRFLNEARIQASLSHPNVATLYDFLELNGQPCIIMEYVDGQTLDERLKSFGGPPPLSESVFIFQAVVEALNYVHSNGIIHRDIKSNNIKISSSGQVKLLDFGIAKAEATPQLTMTGDVVGTLHYLSPEQLKGGLADARSDIWALGVLLYEMVTGRIPFEAPTIGSLCEKIMKASYHSASSVNPSTPREVEAVISRCLKKSPGDRYQSAYDLLKDTMKLAALVSTPRLSSIDNRKSQGSELNIEDLIKRHWGKVAAAFSAVLVLVVIAIYALSPEPVPAPPVTPSSSPIVGDSNAQIKGVRIAVTEGSAEVFRDSKYVGSTPVTLNAQVGERLHIVLKQQGYQDKVVPPILVEAHSDSKPFTFTMDRHPKD
jgi:serine/threonine-protein kinase